MEERFDLYFDPRYRTLLLPLGVRPHNSHVTLTEAGVLDAVFGRYRIETPIANVAGVEITRNYRWYRAIGLRGSRADSGVTFGSNTRAGLCIKFHEPVKAVLIGWKHHRGLTVTVADVEGLAASLERRIAEVDGSGR